MSLPFRNSLMAMEEFEKLYPNPPPDIPIFARRTAVPLRTDSVNGQYTAMFVQACQAKRVTWEWSFYQVSPGCFDVQLKINGDVVDRIGQYASHKDAKEEICKKHISAVQAMPDPATKKRKSSGNELLTEVSGLDEENWVGIVNGQ
jgi:hypothetical protein